MRRAFDSLFVVLLVGASAASMATIAFEEAVVAYGLGHLEVAVDEDQRTALNDATFADVPPAEAIAYFRKKRILTPRQMAKVEDAYGARAFEVAGLQQRFQVERVHGFMADALERGTTRRDVVKQLGAQYDKWGLTRAGKHHVETVFQTNVLGAYAAGRFAQMNRPDVRKRRPYWQYKTAGDHRVRASHVAMDGRVFPADAPVWDQWYPPNGFSCRCGVVSMSQRDVDREGVDVKAAPPRQVETPQGVVDVMPDRGWAGSPRTQARADKAVARVRKQVRKLGLLRAPSLARIKMTGPVHNSAGDLLRTEDARRNAKVDNVAGLTPARAEALARDQPFFNVFPHGQLGRVPSAETWVEVPVYSQNLDTVDQLIGRLASRPRMGHLADRVRVVGRASYGQYQPALWPDPEVAYDRAAAVRLGLDADSVMSRTTETVVRIVATTPEEVAVARELALSTEVGHGSAVRRAWETGDLRVRGKHAGADDDFADGFLNRRRRGAGHQVVLSRERPFAGAGWSSEPIAVNRHLHDWLPEG